MCIKAYTIKTKKQPFCKRLSFDKNGVHMTGKNSFSFFYFLPCLSDIIYDCKVYQVLFYSKNEI